MSKYFSPIFVKLDLRRFKTFSDFERVRDDNGIPEDKMDCKILMELKQKFDFIFYDINTFYIVAYIRKGQDEIRYVSELADHLKEAPTLSFKKQIDFSGLEIDIILDKISASGMASLTKKEKAFLESQSRK